MVSACHVGGVLPRSEALIAAFRRLAEGRGSDEELRELARRETAELIELQKTLGLTYVVEGQLLWHDILRPFSELLQGVKVGPLTRWFDNNIFYKKPIIVSNILRTTTIIEKYLFTELVRGLKWKLILPEPYTFYQLSLNQAYSRWEDLVVDFADVVSEELKTLGNNGPSLLQLSAPCLALGRLDADGAEVVKEALRIIKDGFGGETMVHLHFTDASKALPWILDAPVNILGLDPYLTDLERIKGYSFSGSVAVGCLDSRNSYVESVGEIREVLELVADCLISKSYHLTTTSDLEYLPRGVAERKMARLAEVFRVLEGDAD